MRILVIFTLLFAAGIASPLRAQSNGSQDSASTGKLRPRWGSYLIQTFPNPANSGEPITLQFYNHQDEVLSCKIYDAVNHLILDVWPKQQTPHMLHQINIPRFTLAAGTYFIRLTTYTASDAEDIVDIGRFVVVH